MHILRCEQLLQKRKTSSLFSPLSLFYFYTTWFSEKHLGFHYHRRAGGCNAPVDFFLERAEQTVGAGMQKEPSQRPGAWWKFSPTSRVNCLLMKAYASHLLTTEELEWVQKQPKTDIPSNIWYERCDPYSEVYPTDFGRAECRPKTHMGTEVTGQEPCPCHAWTVTARWEQESFQRNLFIH